MSAPPTRTTLARGLLVTGLIVLAVVFGASPAARSPDDRRGSHGSPAPSVVSGSPGTTDGTDRSALPAPCGELQARIDATARGATLDLSGCSYTLASQVVVSRPITVRNGTIRASVSALLITSSEVTIEDMTIRGPGYDAERRHYAIEVRGSSAGSYVRDITISGNTITDWDGDGIFAQFVESFRFVDNAISNIWYAGIECFSVRNGRIAGNRVMNVIGQVNAYGITLSRGYGGGLDGHPRSSDVQVHNNTIEDIPTWEGLDTHGGERIEFADNVIRRVLFPIVVRGAADESGGRALFAPLDIAVVGNLIDSEVDDGSMAGQAINFIGANAGRGVPGSSTELATGVIEGNSIRGYGLQSSGEHSAIKVSDTLGLQITGNTIVEPSPTGIQIYLNNYDFTVAGNTIRDAWSADLDRAYGIFVQSDYNTGVITGNRFIRGTKSAPSVLTRHVVVADKPHNDVVVR
jgi:hypothetical protein